MRFLLLVCCTFFAINSYAQKENFKVFQESKAPFGLYKSSNNFLNLEVSDTEVIFSHVPSMEGDGTNNFFRKKGNGKKGDRISPKDYFASSDGKTFYIAYNGQWYRARRIDGEYCFLAHPARIPDHLKSTTHIVTGYGGSQTDWTRLSENDALFKMIFSLEKAEWIPIEKMKTLREH